MTKCYNGNMVNKNNICTLYMFYLCKLGNDPNTYDLNNIYWVLQLLLQTFVSLATSPTTAHNVAIMINLADFK